MIKKGVNMKLEIEYVDVESINQYENNAREHHDADIDAIAKSIEEFGFNDPIGVWNNTIVEGHGRLMAAQKLGLKQVPIIRLDELTDEQRKAYGLAHNKTAELSNWDFDILDAELADICNIDMSQFGFVDDAIEPPKEPKEANITESISVVIDCEDDLEAEVIFNKLSDEGYKCRISTL